MILNQYGRAVKGRGGEADGGSQIPVRIYRSEATKEHRPVLYYQILGRRRASGKRPAAVIPDPEHGRDQR